MDDKFLSTIPDSKHTHQRGHNTGSSGHQCFNVNMGGSLSQSDHTAVDFAVLRNMCQVKNKINILNIRKVKFQLFKDLDSRNTLENYPQ